LLRDQPSVVSKVAVDVHQVDVKDNENDKSVHVVAKTQKRFGQFNQMSSTLRD